MLQIFNGIEYTYVTRKRDNNQPFEFQRRSDNGENETRSLNLSGKRDKRRDQRERSSPSVRAERLAITKGIENEIVYKQEDPRGSRYKCQQNQKNKYNEKLAQREKKKNLKNRKLSEK